MKKYYLYILTNTYRGVLYVGVTGDLVRRLNEHQNGLLDGFTKKYFLKKLVYVESYTYVSDALRREKMLKNWQRDWKIALIESRNPEWLDLSKGFLDHS